MLIVCPTLLHPMVMGEMVTVLTPHASVALATTCCCVTTVGADTVKGGLHVTTGAVLSKTVTGAVHSAEFPDWSNTVTVAETRRPTLEHDTLVGLRDCDTTAQLSVALAKTSLMNKGATPDAPKMIVAFLHVTMGLVTSLTKMGQVANALPRMLVA